MGRSSGPPSRAKRGVHSARSCAASGPGAPLHDIRAAFSSAARRHRTYVGHCTWGGPPGRLHERSEASLYVGHCTWGGPPGRLHQRSETSTPREVARPAGQEPRSTIKAAFSSEARQCSTYVGRSSGPPSRAKRDVHSTRSCAASGPGAPLHDKRAPQELPGPICPGRFIAAFKLRSNYPTI